MKPGTPSYDFKFPSVTQIAAAAATWAVITACVLTAFALGGCSSNGDLDLLAPAAQVNITSDSFCAVAHKVTWSVANNRQTIDDARRHNARVDRLCGKGKASDTPAPKATS